MREINQGEVPRDKYGRSLGASWCECAPDLGEPSMGAIIRYVASRIEGLGVGPVQMSPKQSRLMEQARFLQELADWDGLPEEEKRGRRLDMENLIFDHFI